MREKIVTLLTGTFNDFINDLAKMVLKFILWHEHDENAESFHDWNFDSDVFVLILFYQVWDNLWVEIIDLVSVWSGFNQL